MPERNAPHGGQEERLQQETTAAVLHHFLSSPGRSATAQELAGALGLKLARVQRAMEDMRGMGLLERNGETYRRPVGG